MDYNFKAYSSRHLNSLISLLDKSFFINSEDKESVVRWKYFDKYLNDQTITYIALDEDNNVVSHYTNIPVFVNLDNRIFKAMICTDMCTDENHRGKGLISKLSKRVYQDVQNRNFDFSIGFSNDSGVKVDRYSNNYGYKIVGRFVRYFKIALLRKNVQYKLVKTTEFILDFHSRSSEYFRIKKDYDYLTWRYLNKPNKEYEIFRIMEKEKVVGFVVLRFLNLKCYVYDIITQRNDKKHMISILRSIENEALNRKIRLIIYNVLDNNYWKNLFNKYKYFKKVSNNVNYYLTIKIHNSEIDQNLILNNENWLLMNGDIL